MEYGGIDRFAVPWWVWVVAAFAAAGLILGAVLWVVTAPPPERVDTSELNDLPLHGPPMGAGPGTPPAAPRALPARPQPFVVNPPSRSAARVRITEVRPSGGAKRAGPSVPPLPGLPPADAGVKDMFPMERIVRHPPKALSTQSTGEDFPGFSHEGRMWTFTGRFAASGEVDLSPTYVDVGGRAVYALSGSAESHKALFVQSRTYPGKYAIYRPAAE
jgi:hypothetical protein